MSSAYSSIPFQASLSCSRWIKSSNFWCCSCSSSEASGRACTARLATAAQCQGAPVPVKTFNHGVLSVYCAALAGPVPFCPKVLVGPIQIWGVPAAVSSRANLAPRVAARPTFPALPSPPSLPCATWPHVVSPPSYMLYSFSPYVIVSLVPHYSLLITLDIHPGW